LDGVHLAVKPGLSQKTLTKYQRPIGCADNTLRAWCYRFFERRRRYTTKSFCFFFQKEALSCLADLTACAKTAEPAAGYIRGPDPIDDIHDATGRSPCSRGSLDKARERRATASPAGRRIPAVDRAAWRSTKRSSPKVRRKNPQNRKDKLP
jgi:hypothetical protein